MIHGHQPTNANDTHLFDLNLFIIFVIWSFVIKSQIGSQPKARGKEVDLGTFTIFYDILLGMINTC
jgi:hypothetical protein